MTDTFAVSRERLEEGRRGVRRLDLFAKLKSSIPVEDLIKGVIVQSAGRWRHPGRRAGRRQPISPR